MTTIRLGLVGPTEYEIRDGPTDPLKERTLLSIADVPKKLYDQIVGLMREEGECEVDGTREKLIMHSWVGVALVTKVAFRYTDAVECRNEALVYDQLVRLESGHFAPILYYGETEILGAPAVIVSYKEVPGMTLKQFLHKCRPHELVNVVVQLFSVLKTAHDAIGFTHYDLHAGNIMVTPEHNICFIDYGSSYVRTDQNTGLLLSVGGVRKETWWLHDVFKLLCSMYVQVDFNFRIKDLEIRLDAERTRLRENITNVVDLVRAVSDYGLCTEPIRPELSEKDVRRMIKQTRRQILKIKRDKYLDRLITRTDVDLINTMFIGNLLRYFTVLDDESTIIERPYDVVHFIRTLERYYAVMPEEATGGSFDDFYLHLLEVGVR